MKTVQLISAFFVAAATVATSGKMKSSKHLSEITHYILYARAREVFEPLTLTWNPDVNKVVIYDGTLNQPPTFIFKNGKLISGNGFQLGFKKDYVALGNDVEPFVPTVSTKGKITNLESFLCGNRNGSGNEYMTTKNMTTSSIECFPSNLFIFDENIAVDDSDYDLPQKRDTEKKRMLPEEFDEDEQMLPGETEEVENKQMLPDTTEESGNKRMIADKTEEVGSKRMIPHKTEKIRNKRMIPDKTEEVENKRPRLYKTFTCMAPNPTAVKHEHRVLDNPPWSPCTHMDDDGMDNEYDDEKDSSGDDDEDKMQNDSPMAYTMALDNMPNDSPRVYTMALDNMPNDSPRAYTMALDNMQNDGPRHAKPTTPIMTTAH